MFSRSSRPRRLAFQITAINAGSLALALILLIAGLNNQYKKDESTLASEKTSLVWLDLISTDIDYGIRLIRNVYRRDLILGNKLYGVRIANGKNDTLLLEYPQSWSKYFNYPISFEHTIEGKQPVRLKATRGDKEVTLNLETYSLSLSSYFIQIIISIEERINFLGSIFRLGVAIIIIIMAISFLIANIVIARVLRPIHKMNMLIEKIIESQQIKQRLEITGRGEYARSQNNFNIMLDVIERQVNRLKQSTINLGHDIRTPLTRIHNQLETILSITKHKKTREAVEQCIEFVDDIKVFAKQVLDLSEIESGLVVVPDEPVDIKTVLSEVIEMYELIAEEKHIVIKAEIEDMVYVYIDAIRLKQLIGNLLDNSVKFSAEHSIVRLTVESVGNKIAFTVTDEGEGISKEDQKYICLPSWKKDSSMGDNSSGFGLAIVESIVQAYKGEITIESTVRKGTKITILL